MNNEQPTIIFLTSVNTVCEGLHSEFKTTRDEGTFVVWVPISTAWTNKLFPLFTLLFLTYIHIIQTFYVRSLFHEKKILCSSFPSWGRQVNLEIEASSQDDGISFRRRNNSFLDKANMHSKKLSNEPLSNKIDFWTWLTMWRKNRQQFIKN